jgi:anti-anti-sigma regulatory factor
VISPPEIDLVSGHAIAAQLTAAIGAGGPVVVAGLTGTTLIDSHGCRPLYQTYREAADAGAQLRPATTQLTTPNQPGSSQPGGSVQRTAGP